MALNRIRDILVIAIILFLFAAIVIFRSTPVPPTPGYLLTVPVTESTQVLSPEVKELVGRINARNQTIHTFFCEHMKISIEDHRLLRVNGEINYTKDRYFRMFIRSIAGLELDIGSNETNFWFWSRRMTPSALYYSSYENIQHTRLKTPFHPVWLKSILGFDVIDVRDAFVRKRGEYWEVVQHTKNMQNQPIIRIILIDPHKMTAIGHYVYAQGQLVCSAEAYEYCSRNGFTVPVKMVIRWYKEDITMFWHFQNPQLNLSLSSDLWEMPKISPKVNIGKPSLAEL